MVKCHGIHDPMVVGSNNNGIMVVDGNFRGMMKRDFDIVLVLVAVGTTGNIGKSFDLVRKTGPVFPVRTPVVCVAVLVVVPLPLVEAVSFISDVIFFGW